MGGRSTPAYTICSAKAPNHGSRTQASKCTRRNFLAIALATAAIPISGIKAAEIKKAEEKKDTRQDDETLQQIEPRVSDTVSLATFTAALESGKVTRVWFYGNTNQTCLYQLNDSKLYRIGEGFPKEAPRGSESPLHVMARVRNLNIPFSVHPIAPALLHRNTE